MLDIIEDNRKYPMQQCQDDKLNDDFRILHRTIVNSIIEFCKKHDIMIDEFTIKAYDMNESIKCGSWQSDTDSCLMFEKYSQEYKDITSMSKIVSEDEFNRIIANEEPFLISM